MTTDSFTFTVAGRPRPQGSKSAGRRRGGRTRVLEGSSSSQRALHSAWRKLVSDEAAVAMANARRITPFRGPVAVHVEFRFHRTRTTPEHHWWRTVTPDVDKLLRSILDSLKSGGALGDDAQVSEITALKLHAPPGCDDGATITIRALDHSTPGNVPPSSLYAGLWPTVAPTPAVIR